MVTTDPNERERTRLRPCACALILGLLAGGAARADYLKDYWDGREAYRNKKYREAVVFFDRAIKVQPVAGGRVRWTGTHFETYLPHFHLGRALDELDLYDRAVEVWEESVRQGKILEKGNRREYRELLEKLDRIRNERFPEELDRLYHEVDAWLAQLQRIQRRGIGGLVSHDPQLGRASDLLAAASESLSDARETKAIGSLGRAGRSVGEAKARLLKALDKIEQEERRRREEAERQRIAEARAGLQVATQALAGGVCNTEWTSRLGAIVAGGGLPGDQARLLALLSRSHERCGDLLRAELYLDLALQAGAADAEALAGHKQAIAEMRRREHRRLSPEEGAATERPHGDRILSAFLIARTRNLVQGCDPQAVETMERLLPEFPAEPAAVEPHLDLARAFRGCGNAERARRYLDLARKGRTAHQKDVEELVLWLERTTALDLYSESHALVVGVARYRADGWGDLPEVLQDVAEVGELLERHGFSVERLVSPTAEELRKRLDGFFSKKRPRNSRLVFYYGGHGHTEINDYLRLGYIVPADTPFPEDEPEGEYLRYLVSMDSFEGLAKATAVNHAMFLFDSCFSGTIFDMAETRFRRNRGGEARAEDVLARPVRLFVTAGDETQMVPAESRFRAAVVRALRGFADDDADGLILGAEVSGFVAEHGATDRNTPQWGMLDVSPFDEGDLAFRVPELGRLSRDGTRGQHALAVELAFWKLVESSGNAAELQQYLDAYPDGAFADLARRGLR